MQGSARSGLNKYFLASSRSGNMTQLPLSLYKMCALLMCMSVISFRPKADKLLGTSTPSSLNLTSQGCKGSHIGWAMDCGLKGRGFEASPVYLSFLRLSF